MYFVTRCVDSENDDSGEVIYRPKEEKISQHRDLRNMVANSQQHWQKNITPSSTTLPFVDNMKPCFEKQDNELSKCLSYFDAIIINIHHFQWYT